MHLSGVEYLDSLMEQEHFTAKMVFNADGAIIFTVEEQHRDQKAAGISYEDDYAGNALAAMLAPGRIEIRYHRDFPDQRIADIILRLLGQPELSRLRDWLATYQGRALSRSEPEA